MKKLIIAATILTSTLAHSDYPEFQRKMDKGGLVCEQEMKAAKLCTRNGNKEVYSAYEAGLSRGRELGLSEGRSRGFQEGLDKAVKDLNLWKKNHALPEGYSADREKGILWNNKYIGGSDSN